jgi:hypothetical protein
MKSFKEYLTESKKQYPFKIKVAGELPENFEAKLKETLDDVKVSTCSKLSTTPIQATPLDFPQLENCEIHMFEVCCDYPIIDAEIVNRLKCMGLPESHFKVRNSNDPSVSIEEEFTLEPSGKSLLADGNYTEAETVKVKNYFGDDFNKGFLKDLEKTSKQRKKDQSGPSEYKLPKTKQDKLGTNAPLSKISNPDPIKGKA